MKLPCNVIEDLLPMYYDNVCSDETAAIIEEHLQDCPHCRQIFAHLRSDIEISAEKPDDIKPLKKLQKSYRRKKIIALITFLLVVAIIPVAFYLGSQQSNGSGEFDEKAAVAIGNAFMETIKNGDYENILSQMDPIIMQDNRRKWLKDSRFDEDDLPKIEAIVLQELNKAGEALDALGGVKRYKKVDGIEINLPADRKVYCIVYSVWINGNDESFELYVTENGVWQFGIGSGSVDNPLNEFHCWFIWLCRRDNIGRRYDENLKEYVFYAKETLSPEDLFPYIS